MEEQKQVQETVNEALAKMVPRRVSKWDGLRAASRAPHAKQFKGSSKTEKTDAEVVLRKKKKSRKMAKLSRKKNR